MAEGKLKSAGELGGGGPVLPSRSEAERCAEYEFNLRLFHLRFLISTLARPVV